MKLSNLLRAAKNHPENQEYLHAYFQESLAAGALDQAIELLSELQAQHPWNHNVRRLLVAAFLHETMYPEAMDAIETLVAFSKAEDDLIDSALAVRKYLGPRTLVRSSVSVPRLSLCMIVKDEQDFLGPCLNSIKSLVDEIIVVDTGSTDRSADIARIYGALVYHFTWRHDFSAARNHAIDQAGGDWIFILDADEVIDRRDHEALRTMINGNPDKSKAYSLETRNYSNVVNIMDWRPNDRSYPAQETSMGWFPTSKVRLFPRFDNIRFDYPVHELVEPSIRKAKLTIETCDIPIHHYGQVNEAKNIEKSKHYFELGYAKLEQLGNDKAALRELAIQAGRLERWSEAIELWDRFLLLCPVYGEAYANMAGAYWQMGHYDQGVAYSKKAIEADPNLKEAHYNLSVNLLMKRKPGRASVILQDLLRDNPTYTGAYFMLAVSLCIQGERKHGRRLFDTLEKDLSKDVLTLAADELVRKFVDNGHSDYADFLKKAAGSNK